MNTANTNIANMNVSLFGLGYVGAVTAACLADKGFNVIGVDINQDKVDLLNAGKSPIIEEKISKVVENAVKSGKLRSTSDLISSIAETDVSLARLVGANKAYIEKGIPHIAGMLTATVEEVVNSCDTIVIGNPADESRAALSSIPAGKTVIDLVQIISDLEATPEGYRGIGW